MHILQCGIGLGVSAEVTKMLKNVTFVAALNYFTTFVAVTLKFN